MMENPDAGFTLCHHIRKKDPSIPVILVTSVNSETGLDFDLADREQIALDQGRRLAGQADPLRAAHGEIDRLLAVTERRRTYESR